MYKDQWETIRDAFRGEDWVKTCVNTCFIGNENIKRIYLPPTGKTKSVVGMNEKERKNYHEYLLRAEFPEKMAEMVRTAIGMLWNKDATIELSPRTEYLRDNATAANETLQDLMMRINAEQFLTSRCGILVDLPSTPLPGVPQPYLCFYKAESILNWDAGARTKDTYAKLNLVVLDESENERKPDFVWQWQEKYRVLTLGSTTENEEYGIYKWGQFRSADFAETQMQPMTLLGTPLTFVPFYFFNATHNLPCVEAPVKIALANKCFSTYRNSADYEQALHEQAQETLVVEGGDDQKEYPIGSHAALFPATGNKAYFIGLQGKGLPEMRAAIQNKIIEMDQMAGQMIDTRSLQRESGEALKTRLAGQTATLASIAKVCGKGLQRCIRDLAAALGDDPKSVVIKPNTDFLNPELFAKTLVELMQAKSMGYPIPDEDLVRMAQERGIIKDDFDTVMAKLKAEPPVFIATGTPTGNPAGKTPKQLVPPAPPGGGASQKSNPTGTSARGKTRNPNSKSK